MKKSWLIMSGSLVLVLLGQVQASRVEFFEANELSADVLGFYGSRDKGGASKSAWGYGAAVNYFLTDKIGLSADTYSDAFTVPYNLNFSGIFRYPFQDYRLAPYGFGGFGRQWDHTSQWTFHVGAGVEYRTTEKTGLFSDIREVFPGRTRDYTLVRFGIRFRFR